MFRRNLIVSNLKPKYHSITKFRTTSSPIKANTLNYMDQFSKLYLLHLSLKIFYFSVGLYKYLSLSLTIRKKK